MEEVKVLVLGVNGMLGHKLFLHLSSYENLTVYGTARSQASWLKFFPYKLLERIHFNIDADNFEKLSHLIAFIKPDLIINCIGIIKQSVLGQDALSSIYVNALLPHKIARVCEQAGIRFLHVSTDCVFSGEKGSYNEKDIPDAYDLYGRCKLLGEVDYPHCLTLRTSIIGHELQSQLGLIEWFLAQENEIQGYTEHIYSGFSTIELARIIARYIIPNIHLNSVYHLSSDPISKYELLKLTAMRYGKDIEIEAYADTFCDRSLDSSTLRNLIGYSPPSWPEMIDQMYQDFLDTRYRIE